MKKRQDTDTARCPYCGTTYRHPTKAEAREVLRKETGLVGLPMKGIAMGEKLDDGRTAADLLATAQGVPGIVARAA